MHFAMMRWTKASYVFDCIGSAIREGDDVVDFDKWHTVGSLKRQMLTTGHFASMIRSLFANRDDEWIAVIRSCPKQARGRSL
jgi:hypothetical protein